MIAIGPDDRLCIAGLGGTGKTYMMRYIISILPSDFTPYIMDPLDQYGEFGEVGDVLQDGRRCIPRLGRAYSEMESVCHKLHAVSKRVLVAEEAEQFIPQRKPLQDYTSSLLQMGRNWNIGVYGTTRRIQDINKVFFDLGQRVFFYRCGLKSREYISDLIGADYIYEHRATKYSVNKTGYTITSLPPYHCIHFDLNTETAEILHLKLGAREHIETVGRKSEAGRETVKAIAEAEREAAAEEEEIKQASGREEAPQPASDEQQESKDKGELWTPKGRK